MNSSISSLLKHISGSQKNNIILKLQPAARASSGVEPHSERLKMCSKGDKGYLYVGALLMLRR